MLKITPQSLLQFDPLQGFSPLDEDGPPATWSGNWVSRRLVEGLKTLRLIPLMEFTREAGPMRCAAR
jgi:hypothetical protein